MNNKFEIKLVHITPKFAFQKTAISINLIGAAAVKGAYTLRSRSELAYNAVQTVLANCYTVRAKWGI